MKPPLFVIGGLISEAYARSQASYAKSLESYNSRVREGLQPSTPFIDIFNVEQQYNLLAFMISFYLIFSVCLFLYMKKRSSGFKLRWILVLYDASNVALAAYIAFSTLQYKLRHGGLLLCNSIQNDTEGYRIAQVFVLFYLQKYLEFFDTWFFLLRKSSRQVSNFFYKFLFSFYFFYFGKCVFLLKNFKIANLNV
jgi:hypothetical protein